MDEFDDDAIARTATEDEEAAAESLAKMLTCPALTMTSRECLQQHPDGKVPVDLLVLGVTEASHILLNHTGRDGTVLGSVAHPACKLAGLRTGDSCNRTLGTTLRGVKHQGGMVVVGTCSTRCPPEVAISTTRGLLSMLQPKSIVVISELHEQDVSKASLQEVQHDFYCLGTSETSAMSGGLHELSAGCTITGMAAAVLSAAEARRIPAVAVISIVQQAFTDVTRKHLSALASQISLAAKACAADAELPMVQDAACEAALKKPWEAPRVYL